MSERQTGPVGIHAWLLITLVVAPSVAVYANSLANGPHVDDQYQIVTNPWIRSLRNLPTIFSSGVWDFDGRISSYYRPVMYVLYSLVYAVAGTEPWAYHLLNVVLPTAPEQGAGHHAPRGSCSSTGHSRTAGRSASAAWPGG